MDNIENQRKEVAQNLKAAIETLNEQIILADKQELGLKIDLCLKGRYSNIKQPYLFEIKIIAENQY